MPLELRRTAREVLMATAQEMVRWQLVDPVGEVRAAAKKLAPRLDSVEGKAVGFRILWNNFDVFMQRFEELLRERKITGQVTSWNLNTTWTTDLALRSRNDKVVLPKQFDDFASGCDWAVIGLGG